MYFVKVCVILFSAKLDERQRDPEERVRQEVVLTICEAAAENINCISDKVGQMCWIK